MEVENSSKSQYLCIITNNQPRGLVVRVWLLIMRSRVRFQALPWEFFLEGKDSLGDHGLGSLEELRFKAPPGTSYSYTVHILPSTSSGQRNRASCASHPQKSVTLRPQPGGETTKYIRDMWWRWRRIPLQTASYPVPQQTLCFHFHSITTQHRSIIYATFSIIWPTEQPANQQRQGPIRLVV
jgi:hypothetical protein